MKPSASTANLSPAQLHSYETYASLISARNDDFENLITNTFETLELECSSTGSLLDFTFPTFAQFL